jgi:MOSC domain-containing protein YiiM
MSTLRIEHLYVSAGHNFFGHTGKPPGEHATERLDEIVCVAGRGIEGDRFFDYKADYKGQITFFAGEIFDDLRAKLGIENKSPAVLRRNVITRGIDLAELFDVEFEVQGVRFRGMGECKPCYWMDHAVGPGAEALLKGRGGLRAKILSDGKLAVDAAVVART